MSAKIIRLNSSPIKLKISLENLPHSVFRRILVPQDINMLQLHAVIQIAMGWEFAHLFQFTDKKGRSSISVTMGGGDDDFDMGWTPELKAEEVYLYEQFFEAGAGAPFWYWYDFGDDWWHRVTFQKPTKRDLEVYDGKPICVEAFGACPPEDVGGPWGYAEFCEAVYDKKHPQYREMREWLGMNLKEKYDFEFVDLDGINLDLLDFYDSGNWNISKEDFM